MHFLLFAVVVAAAPQDWVPARWPWTDPSTLALLDGSPVNCLLVDQPSAEFAAAAAKRGVATLAVAGPDSNPLAAARSAAAAKHDGLVLDGDFPDGTAARLRDTIPIVVELPSRARLRLDQPREIVGTSQAVWAGIRILDEKTVKGGPTGGVWIDTNLGFVRAVRSWGHATVWLANRPPEKTVIPAERYAQVIGDTASAGARWVVSLDDDLAAKLRAGDAKAIAAWRTIGEHLSYWESHKAWRTWRPYGQLAVVQDSGRESLLSGGILDMIAVKHTPVRAVPRPRVSPELLQGATMAVNVDTDGMTQAERDALRAFARSGGTLLSGPPGWKSDKPRGAGQITLETEELERIDGIWKEVNAMIGRRNLGARLFNVSTALSTIAESADGGEVVVHLVNYSEYPIENVTVHLLGEFKEATVLAPGAAPKKPETYKAEEGTGVDLETLGTVATLVLKR